MSLPPTPALVVGEVAHARLRPRRHAFAHRHYQWLVDLDHLPSPGWPLRLIGRFDERDHLDGGRLGGGIRGDVVRWLGGRGIDVHPRDRVLMLAHARSLGHAFDPLTVFWVLDAADDVRAVVMEVHNTYGERHPYLVLPDASGRARVDKQFYVSPFNDLSGHYDVVLRLGEDRVTVGVDLVRDGLTVLATSVSGEVRPAGTRTLVRTWLSHLFLTHRVSLLIRLHGIRLWLARLPVQPRPIHSSEAVR